MKEGAWINAETRATFWIFEHSTWVQNEQNAQLLGVPQATWRQVQPIQSDFDGSAREEIVLRVLASGPFIRARGHGARITFEFMAETSQMLPAIRDFCTAAAGEASLICLTNLRSRTTAVVPAPELCNAFDFDFVARRARPLPAGSLSPFAEAMLQALTA